MNIAFHYVIPIMLVSGGLWLSLQELKVFRRSPNKPWVRLLRRLGGGVVLAVIAFMLFNGDTTLILMDREQARALAQQDRQYVSDCLNYWTWVMFLVLGTVGLALWDVVDGLKHIKHILQESKVDDI